MSIIKHLSKHIRDVHFGGNWTVANLKDKLEDVNVEQALRKVESFNTIAVLTFHIHYFIDVASKVLEGGPLVGDDKLSFDHPPITSEEDWNDFKEKVLKSAAHFADLVEQLPEERLWEDFTDKKYGNYYRNIQGIIEHSHYHLGQISLIKKML